MDQRHFLQFFFEGIKNQFTKDSLNGNHFSADITNVRRSVPQCV